jgi:predicted DNA-binding transcriptional regulator AlpA
MTVTNEVEPLASPAEVAAVLGISTAQLANFRYLGTGPAFVKVGRRVRYRWSDLAAYVEAQTRQQTGTA